MKNNKKIDFTEELENFKRNFKKLRGKTDPGLVLMFDGLICVMSLMIKVIEELSKKKTSSNSHIPPSQDPNRNKDKKTGNISKKKPGGQNGHEGKSLLQIENPNEVIVHKVDKCNCCANKLNEKHLVGIEKRQVFDIKTYVWVTEHQVEIKSCKCGNINTASFPLQVNAPVQYGNGVKALVVYLNQYQLIPYNRVIQTLNDKFGLSISEGSIANFNKTAFEKLQTFEETTKEELLESGLLFGDETGASVNKKKHWIHILSNERSTLYNISEHRGIKGINEMGILSRYTGFLMHDFWSSYFSFDQCVHLICNSHLLRELEFSSKEEKQQWAKKIKELLDICYIEKDLHNGNLPYKSIVKFEKRYDNILKAANKECPEKVGSRKRIAQTKSRCLLERMINYKNSILMFLYHEDFPFTNNQAERDFRMTKVQQKISGQFKSIQGAKWFCRIRSFISTCRKRDVNIKDALLNVFNSA